MHECFHRGAATFMILGNLCTRGCGFCSVPKGSPAQKGICARSRRARERRAHGRRHETSLRRDHHQSIVTISPTAARITSPKRCAKYARALPDARVEVLTPDFCGDMDAVARVLDAGPHVFNHNMETVRASTAACAPRRTTNSLSTSSASPRAIAPEALTKSGLMAGLGEEPHEVRTAAARPVTPGTSTSPPSASICSPRAAISP